ncbi:MAG: LysM peptidoglycan-binding domain-containing protein [Proteobacteria bacterium]|nr:LysM peptidoglycan-binding domain-containing protein [Pseudomonadota bacterium]
MKKYTVQAGDTLSAIAVTFYGQSSKAKDIGSSQ